MDLKVDLKLDLNLDLNLDPNLDPCVFLKTLPQNSTIPYTNPSPLTTTSGARIIM